MLGRRRQSIQGGFGQLSPQRGPGTRLGSSHGRVSPRTSSHNLTEAARRLSSLAEAPISTDSPLPPTTAGSQAPALAEAANGTTEHEGGAGLTKTTSNTANGVGTEPSENKPGGEPAVQDKQKDQKDADGFTVPVTSNDPISQAEKDAAEVNGEAEQLFKVNIQKEPIPEEDADAKQAALSNVASTLTAMGMPSRKGGTTIRGRRDVRNTIYVAGPELTAENPFPSSPALSQQSPQPSPDHRSQAVSKPAAGVTPAVASVPALASTPATFMSEASIAATSDTQSVRSGRSLASITHFQHPDIPGPGLNGSIIEAVSALFEGSSLKTVKVVGEIAVSYTPSVAPDATGKKILAVAVRIWLHGLTLVSAAPAKLPCR